MKNAAGIHFSTFQDPKNKGKAQDQQDIEADAIAAGAATVRPNHRPDAAWKAKHFAPADPDADSGIKILESR